MDLAMPETRQPEERQQQNLDDVSSSSSRSQSHQRTSEKRNPMMNPVVLARLFEICELSDLHRFRLVSKQWYELSLTRCRNEMTVRIYNLQGHRHRRCRRHNDSRVGRQGNQGIQEWFRFEFDIIGKPFRCFQLDRRQSLCCDRGFFETFCISNMKKFLDLHGEWIRELKLYHFEIDCVNSFKKAIFQETPNLEELIIHSPTWGRRELAPDDGVDGEVVQVNPKLKSLAIHLPEHNRFPFPITWRLIFSHFPNIQSMHLSRFELIHNFATLVKTLEEMAKSGKKLTLNSFHWDIFNPQELAREQIKKFIQLPGLELTHIDLELGGSEDAAMSLLPEIMILHGTALNELRLTYLKDNRDLNEVPHNFQPYTNFPFRTEPFIKLTKVSLEGPISRKLNFLELCPNLKVLKLHSCYECILAETNWRRLQNLSLPHVEVFHADFPIPESVMKLFVKWMPNVERLYVNVLTPSLRVVFQNWKNLTQLEVISNNVRYADTLIVGDSAITGIVDWSDERLPNLTDLTKLRDLAITSAGMISDASVWDGFLKMPEMKYLDIEMSHETTSAAMDALEGRFPDSFFTINIRQRLY